MKKNLPPIFIIAGMPRCGTTFLYHNFQKHPSIFCPFRKETNYFSVNFQRGVDWYHELFEEIVPGQIGLDASPSYFLDQQTITRIKDLLPDAKIILGVRNPVDWSLSLYNQLNTHLWKNHPTFDEFIESYPYPFGDQVISIELRKGHVVPTIDLYRKVFGENLLLYQFDFFQENPFAVARAIENHLDIPVYFNGKTFDTMVINAGNRKNIRLLTYILSREKLISLLGNVFPRRLAQTMRIQFDKFSNRDQKPNLRQVYYSPEDRETARLVFAEEEIMVRSLFAEHPLIRGDGSPAPF